MSLKSELQELLNEYVAVWYGDGGLVEVDTPDKALGAILDLLDKSLPSHRRQVHVEHGQQMPSVAQCKWYFDGYDQALADIRKVIKEG